MAVATEQHATTEAAQPPPSAMAQAGAPILALLSGYGNSCDAAHMSRPDRDGQIRAMRAALEEAALPLDAIGYLNAIVPGLSAEPGYQAALAVALIWTVTLVLVLGVKEAGLVQLFFTILKLVPLALVIVWGFAAGKSANLPPLNPLPSSWPSSSSTEQERHTSSSSSRKPSSGPSSQMCRKRNNTCLHPPCLAPAMRPLFRVGSLLILAAIAAAVVSWLGALRTTWQLEDKTWFASLLAAGLLGFGVVAMAAYVVAGPDGTRQVAVA